MTGYQLSDIASKIGATVKGDAACRVFAINTIQDAKSGDIAFLSNPKYQAFLTSTQASALILAPDMAETYSGNALVMDNPYLGFAKVAQLLDTTPDLASEQHSRAVIAASAKIDPSAKIAANVVIEEGASIAADVQIGANCVIGKGSSIGTGTRIYPNVSIYHGVTIGARGIIHSGSVIGSDGFGFANERGAWVKIPQLGGVVIGDDFECGANCTIDRGAIRDTVIGNDVKLDNMCHLAHNVQFGSHSAMAAYSGVAGSSSVGEYCTISGRVTILGHIELADGVHITAGSQVSKSLEKGAYSSGTPLMPNREWKRSVARMRQLDDMARSIKQLEKELAQLKQSENNNE
ncbi:MAG: UDP-3-O-(3-hydroxymyristoyl)glucosamine N-acyltransferase [Gammaproteobacteria bacterium]|nr:UDP-3-O-(3-hydroxymyristoyl)glucosamine N-acyltransferase [Gammaproteobacteria bacterium]NVK87864.1 UDP-3-O-(3-hydroxymyristoyl)glucosamine N-acyltransferase [Gammaproteobacteria bacterium]